MNDILKSILGRFSKIISDEFAEYIVLGCYYEGFGYWRGGFVDDTITDFIFHWG